MDCKVEQNQPKGASTIGCGCRFFEIICKRMVVPMPRSTGIKNQPLLILPRTAIEEARKKPPEKKRKQQPLSRLWNLNTYRMLIV